MLINARRVQEFEREFHERAMAGHSPDALPGQQRATNVWPLTPAQAVERYGMLCSQIAAGFYAPGFEREDLEQEAQLGLLSALRTYRPELGTPFKAFARLCIRRRLIDVVKMQRRDHRRTLNESVPLHGRESFDGDDPVSREIAAPGPDAQERIELRDYLRALIVAALDVLTDMELRALVWVIFEGHPYHMDKAMNNALQRARIKLRRVAEEMAA